MQRPERFTRWTANYSLKGAVQLLVRAQPHHPLVAILPESEQEVLIAALADLGYTGHPKLNWTQFQHANATLPPLNLRLFSSLADFQARNKLRAMTLSGALLDVHTLLGELDLAAEVVKTILLRVRQPADFNQFLLCSSPERPLPVAPFLDLMNRLELIWEPQID